MSSVDRSSSSELELVFPSSSSRSSGSKEASGSLQTEMLTTDKQQCDQGHCCSSRDYPMGARAENIMKRMKRQLLRRNKSILRQNLLEKQSQTEVDSCKGTVHFFFAGRVLFKDKCSK